MRVYTRSGDKGETSLWGGKRVSKGDLQVEAYGTVDEASSFLGLACGLVRNRRVREVLPEIQRHLQALASELASSEGAPPVNAARIGDDHTRRMECLIDEIQECIPPLTGFVLPGGTAGAGAVDVARTVVRRAERLVVRLSRERAVRDEVIRYLNRLSDLLFVLARAEAGEDMVQEVKGRVLERLACEGGGLTLGAARRLIAAAARRASELDVPVVAAVCDAAGHLLALERQEGALIASINIAWNKAYTASVLRTATHELAGMAQPGRPLYGIDGMDGGRIVILGGGYPLVRAGRVAGGLGVSGGTVEQDMDIARAAIEAWEGGNGSGN